MNENKLPVIKFSHTYFKMPPPFWSRSEHITHLVGMSIIEDINNLPKEFLDWDTAFESQIRLGNNPCREVAHYKLPKGKCILLTFFTQFKLDEGVETEDVWTTVRRWEPYKERYYYGLIGKQVEIEFVEEGK